MGNLACHEALIKSLVSTDGLLELIVDQLFLDDAQCLCEVCRYLAWPLIFPSSFWLFIIINCVNLI